jgi:hypothetical protein
MSENTRREAALGGTPDHPSSQFARRDPWVVIEGLLQSLTDAGSANKSLQATVEAAAEVISADAAFWYARSSARTLAVAGPRGLDPDWCTAFARKLPADPRDADDVTVWTAPKPGDGEPTTALVCRSGKTSGVLVAVSFDPARVFDAGDRKAARLTLKMLLAQRAQQQAGTKQLLVGLLHTLTTVIDAKDSYTAGHSERVARIATLIARQMNLSAAQVGDVYLAGLLHDVGKIGVRDEVLQKPGALTREEYEEIQQHSLVSDRVVGSIKPFDRLRGAVRHHHERWDGCGYPDRLSRDAIPLLARVLAVADACDAMMSPRRYRPGRSPVEIDAAFARETGRQFDPAVVKAFLAVRHEIYPPIYQKGIGDSAFHAVESIVDDLTDTAVRPTAPPPVRS